MEESIIINLPHHQAVVSVQGSIPLPPQEQCFVYTVLPALSFSSQEYPDSSVPT